MITAPPESTYVPVEAVTTTPASPQPAAAGKPCAPVRHKHDTVSYKLRHHKVPPAVMASLAAGAWAGNHLADLTGHLIPGLVNEVIYLVAAVLFWLRADKAAKDEVREMEQRWNRSPSRKQRRRAEQNRRYQTFVSAAGAAWLAWTYTGIGTAAWSGVALVAGGAAYWAAHALRYGLPAPREPRPVTTEIVDDVASRLKYAWENYVSAKGYTLPGSIVAQWENIEVGGWITVELVRGLQSIDNVEGLKPKLKGALQCADVTVEPAYGRDGDPNFVKITAITRQSEARGVQTWDRPGLEADGRCRVAGYVDKSGDAKVTIFEENGAFGGFAAGDTGGGKTQVIKNVAISLAAGPEEPVLAATYGGVVGVHLDGSRGASDPAYHQWCRIRAKGTDESRYVLQGLERLLDFRTAQNNQHGWKGFSPYTQNRSLYLVGADEFQTYTRDKKHCLRILERLVSEGRRVGITVWGATQEITLTSFGESERFRSQLMARNTLVFYSGSSNPGALLNHLPINPRNVTAGPGYVVLGGRNQRGTEARTYLADDELLTRYPSNEPTPGEIKAMRLQGYLDAQPEADAYLAAMVRAVELGEDPPEPYIRPCMRPPVPEKPAAPVAPTVTAAEPGKAAVLHLVQSMPSFGDDEPAQPAPAYVPPAPAQPKVPSRDTVLMLLAQGVTSSGDLQARGNLSETWVRNVCTELVKAGFLVEKASKFDPWTLTPAGYMEAGRLTVIHPNATTNPLRSTS